MRDRQGCCQCYSQQGTRLQFDKNQCAQVVEAGFFMAFDPDQVPVQKELPQQQPQTVVQVGTMGEAPQRRLDPIDLAVFDEPDSPRHWVRR
ncbi:hypothetical protein [Cupriavidus sp. WS]|uniref:hypothetical protein n=1 Tax=Cupriavidus sp. WS TaxID=1312922 RepID=UPI00038204D2|nr:hypothetical protein [Cupriavidus sp. WS]